MKISGTASREHMALCFKAMCSEPELGFEKRSTESMYPTLNLAFRIAIFLCVPGLTSSERTFSRRPILLEGERGREERSVDRKGASSEATFCSLSSMAPFWPSGEFSRTLKCSRFILWRASFYTTSFRVAGRQTLLNGVTTQITPLGQSNNSRACAWLSYRRRMALPTAFGVTEEATIVDSD